MAHKQHQKLTKAEEEVMHLLWNQKEPVTVSQLIEDLDPQPPHSTISSIVRILEKKSFVDHKTYGRTHVYFPTVNKEQYTRNSLKGFARKYFAGSMNELVSFLVKERDLSIKDLNEIIKKLDKE